MQQVQETHSFALGAAAEAVHLLAFHTTHLLFQALYDGYANHSIHNMLTTCGLPVHNLSAPVLQSIAFALRLADKPSALFLFRRN